MSWLTSALEAAAAASETHPMWQFMSNIVTVVGVVFTGFFAYRATMHARVSARQATTAAEQSTQANDAVNHKHESADRLFDMMVEARDATRELKAWKEKWDGLPAELANADAVVTHFAVLEDRIERSAIGVHKRIDTMDRDHRAEHEELRRVITTHIENTGPKIDALAAAQESKEPNENEPFT